MIMKKSRKVFKTSNSQAVEGVTKSNFEPLRTSVYSSLRASAVLGPDPWKNVIVKATLDHMTSDKSRKVYKTSNN